MEAYETDHVVKTRSNCFLQGTHRKDELPQRDGQPDCQVHYIRESRPFFFSIMDLSNGPNLGFN